MTLCIAWRKDGAVRFASDSRITIEGKCTDIGIKVLSIPYCVYYAPFLEFPPFDAKNEYASGELGMCYSGSSFISTVVKESIAESLKFLQYIPSQEPLSIERIARLVFVAYRVALQKFAEDIRVQDVDIIIGGLCPHEKRVRVFQLSKNQYDEHLFEEILEIDGVRFVGAPDAIQEAKNSVPENAENIDYVNILTSIINDERFKGVGGSVQIGRFKGSKFEIMCTAKIEKDAEILRGALNLNSDEFVQSDRFLRPSLTFLQV